MSKKYRIVARRGQVDIHVGTFTEERLAKEKAENYWEGMPLKVRKQTEIVIQEMQLIKERALVSGLKVRV